MESFEPTTQEMVELNLQLLKNSMYSDTEKECIIEIMPDIIQTMQKINDRDNSLVYEDLFHAICLKRLSALC